MADKPHKHAWAEMRQRCNNPKNKSYPDYGGRGIRVCERWASFAAFAVDMGSRPSPSHSLDRIDNDGDYEPGNCRWSTITEQNSNSRHCRYVEVDGKRLTWKQAWRLKCPGIAYRSFTQRMNKGWPLELAFTPVPLARNMKPLTGDAK